MGTARVVTTQSVFDFDAAEQVIVATFTIPGEPVSKARARFTSYGSKTRTYSPEMNRKAEEAVAWRFLGAAGSHVVDADHSYGVVLTFVNGTRQRRDLDNMTKLILDGLNKIAWADDNQVVEISARKMLATAAEARTEVTIYHCGPIQRRETPCTGCGTPITTYPSWKTLHRFCTVECRSAWRSDRKLRTCPTCRKRFSEPAKNMYCSAECKTAAGRVELVCEQCGKQFSRFRSWAYAGAPICSPECRAAYWRGRKAKSAAGTCSSCGGPTTKKSYIRCRACTMTTTKPKRGDQ